MLVVAAALHIVLSFQPAPPLSDTTLRSAIEEVARIWCRHGVTVELVTDSSAPIAEASTVLAVTPAAGRHLRYDAAHGIGALDFSAAGMPQPHITIDYVGLVRLMRGLTVLGKKEGQWPIALRDQTQGRILGRVLAHEIGHFLLTGRTHLPAGLMRAHHRITELADGADASYQLEGIDSSRVSAAVVAAGGSEED